MSEQATKLLEQALQLPKEERDELAMSLLDSLEPPLEPMSEEEWEAVFRRRIEDLQTGREKGIPWEEARRMILAYEDDADAARAL